MQLVGSVALAALLLLSAALAHHLAGGMLPGAVPLVASAAGLLAGSALVLRRDRPLLLAGWAGASQVGLHLAFGLSMRDMPAVATRPGLHPVLCGGAATHPTAAMVTAHAVAATAVALAGRGVARSAAAARALLAALALLVWRRSPAAPTRLPRSAPRPARRLRVLDVAPLRGPPPAVGS